MHLLDKKFFYAFTDSMADAKIKHMKLCTLLMLMQYGLSCPKIVLHNFHMKYFQYKVFTIYINS